MLAPALSREAIGSLADTRKRAEGSKRAACARGVDECLSDAHPFKRPKSDHPRPRRQASDQGFVTFKEGAVAYDHNDAAGFIRLNGLRLERTPINPYHIRRP